MSQLMKPVIGKYKPKDPKHTCRYCTHAVFIYLDEKVKCMNEQGIFFDHDRLFEDSCPLCEIDENDPRVN